MITYSYNNITLPALPEVSGYPYALITSVTGKTFDYALMYETKPFRYTDSTIVFEVNSEYLVYVCNSNSSSWAEGTLEIEDGNDGAVYCKIDSGSDFVWSNEDITTIQTSYLYGGVDLPQLPVDVLAEYPCCFIRAPSIDHSSYYAWFSTDPWYFTSDKFYKKSSSKYVYYRAKRLTYEPDSEWILGGSYNDTGALSFDAGPVWTNTDIYTSSAMTSVYLEASDPVPVVETIYIGTEPVASIFAATPVLTTNLLDSYSYEQGDISKTLGIVAKVADDGVLSYQWYCNDEAISEATSNTYRPTTNQIGIYTYYCQVTNTYESYTATVNSNTVTITVTESLPETPKEIIKDFKIMGWLVGWNMMKLRKRKPTIYDIIHEGDVLYIRNAPAITKDDTLEVT